MKDILEGCSAFLTVIDALAIVASGYGMVFRLMSVP